MPKATAGTVAFGAGPHCACAVLPLPVGEPVVLGDGAPPVLELPPVVVVVGGVGSSDVVGGGVDFVVVGGFGVDCGVDCGGGLPPVSSRGGGGGGSAWVTTVVVVLPSGLTETTVVGALDAVVADALVGTPPTVDGPLDDDGVLGTVCRPACEVPWPPVPPVLPAVVAGSGPASSATAANAVATTNPATPSTTYPVRFGLLLFGGAVSILVTGELEADPSGRGIAGSSGVRESAVEAVNRSLRSRAGEPGRTTSAARLSPSVPHSPR